ncbi:MAG: hypothetical protein BalsKO_04790 [Balneolaceae bacterium]
MPIKSLILLLFITLLQVFPVKILAFQQNDNVTKRIATAQKINAKQTPTIDGILSEPIWDFEYWESSFIQQEPNENTEPSEQTAFSIFYDSKNIYIGVKNFDRYPESINSRIARRDNFDGDWIEILFDSYHDLRSAFSFAVSVSGVKGDKMISQNGTTEDKAWDPIWYVETNMVKEGWIAEIRIPLSQLRFGNDAEQIWGFQLNRRLFRNEETSAWQRIPLDAPGLISEFGELHGLKNLSKQKQVEIQPFLITSLQTFEREASNPFRNNYAKEINAGLDGKIGITNDLTLDFTLNPDFGQVEADPAAIALDGFQLFFDEQRPFFTENKNIFNYQFSTPSIGSPFSRDNLFYSRRIGRAPQTKVQNSNNEYQDAPQRTSIIGAVKFSGKTKNGVSIGLMESVTSSEFASISDGNITRKKLVEPLTNYFVSRVQKDFNNRNTFLGGILTSTYRDLTDETNLLHKSAITGGVDFMHHWNDRSWFLGAHGVFSHVKGSRESILQTQESISHLFQRIGADHINVDTTRTSLTGSGGDLKFGKTGKGNIRFETGLTWRSPKLELNDIGFMREADIIQNYATISYHKLEPFSIFRNASVNYKHWLNWDFEGNLNYFDWDVEGIALFKNNWSGLFGLYHQPIIYSKSLLFGGPRLYLPGQYGAWWAMNTDHRKKLFFNYNGWNKTGGNGSLFLFENTLGVTFQPTNRLSTSITPRYSSILHRIQYTSKVEFQSQSKYVTSYLDQKTFGVPVRLNFTINTALSIQYYGEPFITVGEYSGFNFVTSPLERTETDRLTFYEEDQIKLNVNKTEYLIDENRDGNTDYKFDNPDFSFAQFRSNLVIRFEYKPGSEIFLVWSQGVTDTSNPRSGLAYSFIDQIFSKTPENIFLIKATFRLIK